MKSDSEFGIVVSTSDLLKFLSCEEVSTFDLARSINVLKPEDRGEVSKLAARLGIESEVEALNGFELLYGPALRIHGTRQAASTKTIEAMSQGVPLIYQGVFLSEEQGVFYESKPDFLLRVESPSDFGHYSYEPVDSKLAKSPKFEGLFQVLDYADALARVQGVLPKQVHIFMANSERASFNTESYIEEVRIQKSRFIKHINSMDLTKFDSNLIEKLDPKPNTECVYCDWSKSCDQYWSSSDSLFRVANITTAQVGKLQRAGITSMHSLCDVDTSQSVIDINNSVLRSLITQARAQIATIEQKGSVPYYELREDAYDLALLGKGLGLLTAPNEGDIFFDIEGDPFYKPDGLEYLFGICYLEDGEMQFKAFWGTDPLDERKAFGDLIDFIMSRWQRFPEMHIYHYASYEKSALSRLASRCNYKIFEVDTILRNDLLVDLYPVVKGTIVLGADSYSLKKVEKLYLKAGRSETVTTAMGSVESFEAWLANKNDKILNEIERYNEMDVRSTVELRDFLLELRTQVVNQFGPLDFRGGGALAKQKREPSDKEQELIDLEDLLLARSKQSEDGEIGAAYQLCSDLIRFYSREEKPLWWRYFNLISPETDPAEYFRDPECIASLAKVSEYIDAKGKRCVTYSFDPTQPIKYREDTKFVDPVYEWELYLDPDKNSMQVSIGSVKDIDIVTGLISIKRNPNYPDELDPEHIVGWSNVPAGVIAEAVRSFALDIAGRPSLGEPSDVGVEILTRSRPRFDLDGVCVNGIEELISKGLIDEPSDTTELASVAVKHLDNSYLVLQGPPGAGKTYLSSQLIIELVLAGYKVFVTANGHHAIDNLFEVVAKKINDPNKCYRVKVTKAKKGMAGTTYIETSKIVNLLSIEGGLVVAGTMWPASKSELAKGFDYGFIDEAGQFSLAHAIAFSTTCRSLVMSGDPQQLAQPVVGSHPHAVSKSVLGHLIGDDDVVDKDLGIFLPSTYRMHPSITQVVSSISYASKLASAPNLEILELKRSSPLPQRGLVYVPVEHENNRYRSYEEVAAARKIAEFLLQRSWIDKLGEERQITPDEIVVVAPYNAQSQALSNQLQGLANVGTVDKFQGKEGAFVIVSLTASDGESSSRGVEFLFSTNRLNVAISRAKVMTIVLASPSLIETKPRTIEQLELLGALAKIVSSAKEVDLNLIH